MILVVGSSGFLGSIIAKELNLRESPFMSLHRNIRENSENLIDMTKSKLEELVSNPKEEVWLINCVGSVPSVPQIDEHNILDANFTFACRLFELAQAFPFINIIHISTTTLLEYSEKTRHSVNTYLISKHKAEREARIWQQSGRKIYILRTPTVVSNDGFNSALLLEAFECALRGEELIIENPEHNFRVTTADFFVRDVIKIIDDKTEILNTVEHCDFPMSQFTRMIMNLANGLDFFQDPKTKLETDLNSIMLSLFRQKARLRNNSRG